MREIFMKYYSSVRKNIAVRKVTKSLIGRQREFPITKKL